MTVLIDGIRYELKKPGNEAELEKAIRDNSAHIFGEESFYFDIKQKIKSKAGIGSIPDGLVIAFERSPRWCVVEVELESHSVYDHVFPQLTKFKRAIEDGTGRRMVTETLYDAIKADAVLEARFKQKIGSGEVHKFLSDLVQEKPIMVVVIDATSPQLEEALADIGGDVRILEFQTYRREGASDSINAYAFAPVFEGRKPEIVYVRSDTTKARAGSIGAAIYALFEERGVENVTYEECEAAAKGMKTDTKFNRNHYSWYKNHFRKRGEANSERKEGGLPIGLRLHNVYKGKTFTAEVIEGGQVMFNGKTYSPSFAAVAAIQSTGSARETENGWTWWKYTDPETGEERPIDFFRPK